MTDYPPATVGDYRIVETSYTLGTTQITVAQPSPTRWGLLFSVGASSATVSTVAGATFGNGLGIGSTFLPLAITYDQFKALVNLQWYGVAGGVVTLTVIEVFYQPTIRPPMHARGGHNANEQSGDDQRRPSIDAASCRFVQKAGTNIFVPADK